MNKAELDFHLKNEQSRGRRANRAYVEFIEPFIKAKREALFQNFQELSIEQTEHLLECKRLLRTLDLLDEEIKMYITTGKLATKTLNESKEQS